MDIAESRDNIPEHIAIIMDGNGRWAASRGLPRTAGHKKGVDAVRRTLKAAGDLGIQYLTFFGFSSENWKRPADEVGELMRLLRFYLRSEIAEIHKNNIRFLMIGDRSGLDPDIVEMIENAEKLTAKNTALTVVLALNYGGRYDIAQAALKFAQSWQGREDGVPSLDDALNALPDFLSTAGVPDPDVLIRTSGEKRISNFLLWQCAYSELVFTDTYWPDFHRDDLVSAIDEYCARERRFGDVASSKGV